MINSIIDSLVSDDDLTKPLLKTLVFAKRIGNEDLATWVTKELNGYSDADTLPPYRYGRTSVLGVMRQNGMLTKQVSLPLTCFGDQAADMLMKKRFTEGISMLDDIVKNTEDKYLGKDFPADILQFLTQQAHKNGCNFQVVSCRQLVLISEIANIKTVITTKLLELLLQVEKDFPTIDKINDNPEIKSNLNSTVNYYMGEIYNIHSTGDGNLINTGGHNTLTMSNTGERDPVSLKGKLSKNGVGNKEIDDLITIISEEQPEGNSFGHQVKEWTKNMLAKSMDGSWNVSLTDGAKLLDEAIKTYFGLQ